MDIIKRNGIIVSSQPIVLSSGKRSNFYYDLKMVLTDPVGATLIGELLYDIISTARLFMASSVTLNSFLFRTGMVVISVK